MASVAGLGEKVRGWLRREPKVVAPRTVLISVPDTQQRRALVQLVQGLGYAPLEASKKDDLMRLLEEQDPEFVLLALDLGLETLDRVRETAPEVPIIMLAASYHDGRTVQALRHGAVAYLAQPFGADDLREVLARH